MRTADLIRAELDRREALRKLIRERFVVNGDARFVVRRGEVSSYVAGALKCENSPPFRALIVSVMQELGAMPIRPLNRHCWRGVRRIDHDEAAALEHAKLQRKPKATPP